MRKLTIILVIFVCSAAGFQLGTGGSRTPTSIGPISVSCTDQGPNSTVAQMDCIYSIPVVDQNGETMRNWSGSVKANGNNAVQQAALALLAATRAQAEAAIQ